MATTAFNALLDSYGMSTHFALNNTSGGDTDRIGGVLTMAQNGSPTVGAAGPFPDGTSKAWAISTNNNLAGSSALPSITNDGSNGGPAAATFGVWFKRVPTATTALGGSREQVLAIGDTATGGFGVALLGSSGNFQIARYTVGALDTGISFAPYLDNEWHQLILRITESDPYLNVDGVDVKSYNDWLIADITSGVLTAGASDGNADDMATGSVSDLFCSGSVGISEAQCAALYAAGQNGLLSWNAWRGW